MIDEFSPSISLIFTCFSAFSLIDIKQIIAYSSIAHMNTDLIGLFSNDINGIIGSIFYGISHGIISSALFLLIGLLYDRFHTRIIKYYRGLTLILPTYISFLFFFAFSNISFPGTAGFIGELLIYIGAFSINSYTLFLVSLGILLLPFYFILAYSQIAFGVISNHFLIFPQDINLKEFNLLLPLVFFTLLFGLFPQIIINDLILTASFLLITIK